MFRKLIILVVFAGLAYWSYSAWKDSVSQRAQNAMIAQEKKERKAQIKAKVSALVKKYDAVVDWPSRLAHNNRTRMSPILTAELQDVWLTGRPILFIGTVSEIARTGESSVLLSMDYCFFDQPHMFIGTDLRLRIQCGNNLAGPLLLSASDPNRIALKSDTAVIAAISSIEASNKLNSEGNNSRVLTGIGECVDVVQIPESIYW